MKNMAKKLKKIKNDFKINEPSLSSVAGDSLEMIKE